MTVPANLALCFATIERPQVAQRLIRSARAHLGAIPIYVADQSFDVDAMASFYAAHDVRLIRMPFDAGVTASRNQLTREIVEDYFVLCDDDFVIDENTQFSDALRILGAHPEIGVVGGRLYDFDGEADTARHWELFLQYDEMHRTLISVPIQSLAPRAREVSGVRFFLCDAVLNFSIMRRAMFENGVSWDERFKSNGEHEDFFLNLKLNTSYRVAYLPTMVAYHHHPEEYSQYRRRLRDRNKGWSLFLQKWRLDQHLELGLGVRTVDDVDTLVDVETTEARFYVNPDLSVRRQPSSQGTLLVDLEGRIATVGALGATGEALNRPNGSTGRLLLRRGSYDLSTALDDRREKPPAEGAAPNRYALEAPLSARAVGYAAGEFYFRYDAALRPERDLVLWYCLRGGSAEKAGSDQRLAAVVRWTADDGAVLVWQSRRLYLDCRQADYWRPALLQLPLAPAGLRWMRFDILSDGEEERAPLATGFLFPSLSRSPRVLRRDAEMPTAGTFALTRLVLDGASPGAPGQAMAEFGRHCAAQPLRFDGAAAFPTLRILHLDQCAHLEALYFENWNVLGRPLVGARLPPSQLGGPRIFTLPELDFQCDTRRIFGFGRRRGLIAMRPLEFAP